MAVALCATSEAGARVPDAVYPEGHMPLYPTLSLQESVCDDSTTAPYFNGTYVDHGDYVTLTLEAEAGFARISLVEPSRNSTVLQPRDLADELIDGFTATGIDFPPYDPSFGPGSSEWTYMGEESARPAEVLLKIVRQQLGTFSRVVLRVYDACPDGGRMLVVDQAEAVAVASSNEREGMPEGFVLEPAYPNPFNPATTIRFTLPQATNIRLTIYDLAGQEVRRLADGWVSAGAHEVVWNGRDASGRPLASGTYFYRLIAGSFSRTHGVTLVK